MYKNAVAGSIFTEHRAVAAKKDWTTSEMVVQKMYTTPAWAFSRLQDDVNSQRREPLLKIDFSTDTTIVFAVLSRC